MTPNASPQPAFAFAARGAEARLLVLCARLELDAPRREALLRVAGEPLDWALVESLAARHGLGPLLHRHLDPMGAVIPKRVRAVLWVRYQANLRRNRAMAAELAAILGLLQADGIDAIAYKGPTLAICAYGELGLREFGDLDILVRRADVPRARRLLRSRGYAPQDAIDPDIETALLRSPRLYELPLVDAARGIMVELHWRSDADFPVAAVDDGWRSRVQTLELEGAQIPTLAPRELMLALCLHGTKHFWGSLGWLVDVAELMRHQPPGDWNWIVDRACSLGCRKRLALGLYLAHELLDAAVPPQAAAIAADQTVTDIAAKIGGGLFARVPSAFAILEAFRMNLRLCDGGVQRLRYLVSVVFTPGWGEWLRWRLPARLRFLYFPLRLARLGRKYLLHPLRKY